MRQPPSAAPFVGRKSALVLLGCITLGWFSPVRAAPPSTPSPDQVKETVFWQQLYANGGHTLYCNHPFKDKTLLIDTDYIYPLRTMAHHLKCSSVRACTGNAQFQLMASDLHNMYPALKAVIRDRRNSLFGTVPGHDYKFENCTYKTTFQETEPPDSAKGNIARAILYMHTQYGLPIPGRQDLMREWNKTDPVDASERQRNDAIDKLQGNRNPYIDHPDKVDDLYKF